MIEALMHKLGYFFQDPKKLELACIHKSYGNEYRSNYPINARDNERLEFLGDAILDAVITEYLLEVFPGSTEGDLSKIRASLVNEKNLSLIAKNLGLGDFLKLGKGENQTGGRSKESILASFFEAIIAALFLDAGFDFTKQWILNFFKNAVQNAQSSSQYDDYKTFFQELAQSMHKEQPKYVLLSAVGPDHEKMFEVELVLKNNSLSRGQGKSKKEAEQQAAKAALEAMGVLPKS